MQLTTCEDDDASDGGCSSNHCYDINNVCDVDDVIVLMKQTLLTMVRIWMTPIEMILMVMVVLN